MSKGIDFTIDIQINTAALLGKFEKRKEASQVYLYNVVMITTQQYIPMIIASLARSLQIATKPGEGQVLYDTPYARKLYYGEAMDFAKDKHPKATAKWLEASKAVHLKDWVAGVTKILEGRNLG